MININSLPLFSCSKFYIMYKKKCFYCKTNLFIASFVFLRHGFILGFGVGISIGPPSAQFLCDVSNTIFGIQWLDFAAFIIAKPKECGPAKHIVFKICCNLFWFLTHDCKAFCKKASLGSGLKYQYTVSLFLHFVITQLLWPKNYFHSHWSIKLCLNVN